MDAVDLSLLVDPHPRRHIVYPCTNKEQAFNAVHLFAMSGLAKQEAVVLIMGDSDFDPIKQRLKAQALNFEDLQTSGQLECIRAEHLLLAFMSNGMPEEKLFKAIISGIINRAKASSPTGVVRIFGQMASLLFSRNEVAGAERLEHIWNEIIETCPVSLLCTYALAGIEQMPQLGALIKLHSCELHSHELASEAGQT